MKRTSCWLSMLGLAWLALLVFPGGAWGEEGQPVRRVSRHAGVFVKPPEKVPTNGSVDGPILGNGDVGVALAGPPGNQAWCIGKNDFWSRTLGRIVTVGGLRLRLPGLAGASYHQEQDLLKAEVRGTFGSPDGAKVSTRSWVSADENLLVVEIANAGSVALAASVELFAGPAAPVKGPGAPALPSRQGVDDGVSWFTRGADPAPVDNGRTVAVACRVLNVDARAGNNGLVFDLAPGQVAIVASAILTDLDNRRDLAAAQERVKGLTPTELDALNAKHRQWWDAFWSRVVDRDPRRGDRKALVRRPVHHGVRAAGPGKWRRACSRTGSRRTRLRGKGTST